MGRGERARTARRGAAAAAAVLALAACAGAPRPPGSERGLCRMEKTADVPLGPAMWMALLLRGLDPRTGRVTSPAVDCSDEHVRWDVPALACLDGAVARTMLPDRPLGDDDVVVSHLSDDLVLVWVQTNRFASGDALGPAALVEVKPWRLTVRALGPLRANATRARLRLERIGGLTVLVAEGDQCASRDPSSCARAARLVPLVGDRFTPAALVRDDGACLAPALVHLSREEATPLPSGWRRRTSGTATLTFGPEALEVQELILVHDLDPRQPTAPPRLFRRAEAQWSVHAASAQLVAAGAPLWTRMMAADP